VTFTWQVGLADCSAKTNPKVVGMLGAVLRITSVDGGRHVELGEVVLSSSGLQSIASRAEIAPQVDTPRKCPTAPSNPRVLQLGVTGTIWGPSPNSLEHEGGGGCSTWDECTCRYPCDAGSTASATCAYVPPCLPAICGVPASPACGVAFTSYVGFCPYVSSVAVTTLSRPVLRSLGRGL